MNQLAKNILIHADQMLLSDSPRRTVMLYRIGYCAGVISSCPDSDREEVLVSMLAGIDRLLERHEKEAK